MFHLPFTYTTLQSLPRHNNLMYFCALWTNASVIRPVVVANSTEQHKHLNTFLLASERNQLRRVYFDPFLLQARGVFLWKAFREN